MNILELVEDANRKYQEIKRVRFNEQYDDAIQYIAEITNWIEETDIILDNIGKENFKEYITTNVDTQNHHTSELLLSLSINRAVAMGVYDLYNTMMDGED